MAADPAAVAASERPSRAGSWILLVAAVVGVAATMIQSYVRLSLALNPGQVLLCDINGQFSCSSVLTAWQSRAFGIPNSWIGMVVFALFASAGVAAVTGSRPSKGYAGFLGFFAAFMLGFTLWFLWQSTFSIGSLCLYCTIIGTSVVVINAVVWRMWNGLGMLPGPLRTLIDTKFDLVFWFVLWAAVAIGIAIGLAA